MIPRSHLIVVLVLVAATVVASLVAYPRLPDPAPIHWNIHGQIDGWGPRWVAAWLGSGCAVFIAALLLILPRLGPLTENFAKFGKTYGRIAVAVTLLMAMLHGTILLAACGHDVRMGATLTVIIGVFYALLGNWMGKVRRNFYVGIRTPWTLASEAVWDRTHRVGGRVMLAAGLLVAVTGLFASDLVCFIALMVGICGSALWAVFYSLYLYRHLGGPDDLTAGSNKP